MNGVEIEMKKIFVLDTNVPLADPMAPFEAFEDNDVVIPAIVLEEIDSKKRNADELGRNARRFSRMLDAFRQQGKLHEGIKTPAGGTLKIEMNHRSFSQVQEAFDAYTSDNRILAVALNLQREQAEKSTPMPVIVVSKDVMVRIKADVLGLISQDYENDRVVAADEIYRGYRELTVPPSIIDTFYKQDGIRLTDLVDHAYPNEFFILKDEFGTSKSAIGRVDIVKNSLVPLFASEQPVWGITPKNAQQRMAMDLLLNDEIRLVTLIGKAGTGKTLLTIAAALSKVEDDHIYKKLLISRPVIPMGKDIGYLPGEKEDKLRPWMQPIFDNLEFLFNTKKPGELEKVLSGIGSIQVEALTYIRGRSIPNQFIIIDEAQNLSKHEVKTIVSRAGEGSKVVLIGDPEQIDHPYLDSTTNGLTYVVEKFKEQAISGHVTLQKGERSKLAQLAADLL